MHHLSLQAEIAQKLGSTPTDDFYPPALPSHEIREISESSCSESMLSSPGPPAAASPTPSFDSLSAIGISRTMPTVDLSPKLVESLSLESVYHPDWDFADGNVIILVCPSCVTRHTQMNDVS
jgi:hypothetical protein